MELINIENLKNLEYMSGISLFTGIYGPILYTLDDTIRHIAMRFISITDQFGVIRFTYNWYYMLSRI